MAEEPDKAPLCCAVVSSADVLPALRIDAPGMGNRPFLYDEIDENGLLIHFCNKIIVQSFISLNLCFNRASHIQIK